jgi:hypothetical protein
MREPRQEEPVPHTISIERVGEVNGLAVHRVIVNGDWELEGPYTACEAYVRERARVVARKRTDCEARCPLGREVTT